LGGSIGAIRVEKMGNNVFSGSLDDSMVEEFGVPVTEGMPIVFVSLFVVSFLSGKDAFMLGNEGFLDVGILLARRFRLELEQLIFNDFESIRVFGFGFVPLN